MLGALFFTPLIIRLTDSSLGLQDDYVGHTNLAAKMLADHTLLTPHPLLQMAIILVKQVFSISFMSACTIVVLFAIAATAALLFSILKQVADSQWIAAVLSISLLLAAPFTALFPLDHHLYFGSVLSG
jgi:hypothetical protein